MGTPGGGDAVGDVAVFAEVGAVSLASRVGDDDLDDAGGLAHGDTGSRDWVGVDAAGEPRLMVSVLIESFSGARVQARPVSGL